MLSVNLFYFITFFVLFVAFIQGTSYFSPIRRLDISLYVCSHCFTPFKEMNFSLLPVNKRFDGMIFTHECKHLQIKLFPFLLGSFSLRYLYYLESPIANSLTLNTDYFVYWFFISSITTRDLWVHGNYTGHGNYGQQKRATCFATLLQSDVARFTTYQVQPCLATNKGYCKLCEYRLLIG